jgi:16S rRNA (cytosine967-C5)-methyltransferase
LRQQAALQAKINTSEAARFSYPQWWINKLKKQYPHQWQEILHIGNMHPPMTLRINRNKTSVEAYTRLLERHDIRFAALGAHAIVLEKPLPVEKIPGFLEGVVSVQDYGAQLAAQLLDAKAGERVLDACCAPGGKTGHILEHADVQLTALDNDELRLQRVQSNLTRLGLEARLLLGDAASHDWFDQQPFDKILADVPCTASGIVRRHVDIKWLRREADIQSFTAQQAKILPSLWQMLAKGGKLLYVTCSIFHEENQAQVDQFLQNNNDATQLPLYLPAGFQSITDRNALHAQLIPSTAHDGFFYALLQKH